MASQAIFKNIIDEINQLEEIYLRIKSVFPVLRKDKLGKTKFKNLIKSKSMQFKAEVNLDRPIDEYLMKSSWEAANWINEAAIIRLYGIMYYYKMLDDINKDCNGWKEVDLMRRMRHIFTKTKLNYEPANDDKIRLRNEIIEHFKLKAHEITETEIPCPVNKVVQPIFEGCRKYVKAKMQNS